MLTCETCGTLFPKNRGRPARWCPEHRAAGRFEAAKVYRETYRLRFFVHPKEHHKREETLPLRMYLRGMSEPDLALWCEARHLIPRGAEPSAAWMAAGSGVAATVEVEA